MPRLPQNLHAVTTWGSPDNAIRKNTQHDSSKVLRLPRKMTMEVSKVLCLPWKMQRILWKQGKSIAPAAQNDFRHIIKHVGMSQIDTPATRNEAIQRWKPPKVTLFAGLAIGTAIRASRGRLRTVADGCEPLRNGCATSSEPRPPEWNGNPCYAFGKMTLFSAASGTVQLPVLHEGFDLILSHGPPNILKSLNKCAAWPRSSNKSCDSRAKFYIDDADPKSGNFVLSVDNEPIPWVAGCFWGIWPSRTFWRWNPSTPGRE